MTTATSVFAALVEAVPEACIPLFVVEEGVFFNPTLTVDEVTVVFLTLVTLRVADDVVLLVTVLANICLFAVCFACFSVTGFLSSIKPTLFRVDSVGTTPVSSDLLAPTFTPLGFGRGGTVDTVVLLVPVPDCFTAVILTVAGAVAGRLCGLAAVETAAFFVTAGLAMSPLLRTEDLLVVPNRSCEDIVVDLMAGEGGLVGDVTPGLGLSAATGGLVVLPTGGRVVTVLGLLATEERTVVVDGSFSGG